MDEKKPKFTLEEYMRAVGLEPHPKLTPEEREHLHKLIGEYIDSKQGKGPSQAGPKDTSGK